MPVQLWGFYAEKLMFFIEKKKKLLQFNELEVQGLNKVVTCEEM